MGTVMMRADDAQPGASRASVTAWRPGGPSNSQAATGDVFSTRRRPTPSAFTCQRCRCSQRGFSQPACVVRSTVFEDARR